MVRSALIALVMAGMVTIPLIAADENEEGFVTIFDGKSMDGWKVAERPESFVLKDGMLIAKGERAHAFYVGDPKPFKDFELKVDVMTEKGSNGGIYFHTKWQDKGWPYAGFETQVNNTHSDRRKTASIYAVKDVMDNSPAQDGKWWTQHIIVKGNTVTIKVDGKTVNEYTEPPGTQAGKDFARKLDSGTFALQAHDPKSVIYYKNIRVKRLD